LNTHLYYVIYNTNTNGTPATPITMIPGQTTTSDLSAIQAGPGSNQVLLVYLSANDDNLAFSTFWNGNSWESARVMQNGRGRSNPEVTYSDSLGRFFVAMEGLNGHIWLTEQAFGATRWEPWVDLNIETILTPAIATESTRAQGPHLLITYVTPGTGENRAIRTVQINVNEIDEVIEGPITETWRPRIDEPVLQAEPTMVSVGGQFWVLENWNGGAYNMRVF
jgi:hypothetical protein